MNSNEVASGHGHWGELSSKVDGLVAEFFENALSQFEYEYNDNYRYARFGNTLEMESFRRLWASGCCGSKSVEFEVDGVRFLFGFNYGH